MKSRNETSGPSSTTSRRPDGPGDVRGLDGLGIDQD